MMRMTKTMGAAYSIPVLALALFLCSAQAGTLEGWSHDFGEAQARAKAENKMIVMDIYADWCGPCKLLDANTLSDERVVKELANFVPVKVNADVEMALVDKYGTGGLPTVRVLGPEGNTVIMQRGYFPADVMLGMLNAAKETMNRKGELDAAVKSKPEDIDAVLDLAGLYTDIELVPQALAELARISPVIEDKGSPAQQALYLYRYGLAYLYSENLAEGRGFLEKLIQRHPDHEMAKEAAELVSRVTFIQAVQKANNGDKDGARSMLEELKKTATDPGLVQMIDAQLAKLAP